MQLLLVLAGVLFFGLFVKRRKQSSNYIIDHGILMTNDRVNELNIPLTEIVEAVKVGKTAKQPSWFHIEAISGKVDSVAIYTCSNVSYLLRVRNAKSFIRELKEQKNGVYTKEKVI